MPKSSAILSISSKIIDPENQLIGTADSCNIKTITAELVDKLYANTKGFYYFAREKPRVMFFISNLASDNFNFKWHH